MPSITGGDSLSPEYAPWAYVGSENQHFVWQTSKDAKHEGYLYRAGMTTGDDGREVLVCERRPLDDTGSHGSLVNRDRVEDVPVSEIPEGLFPSMQTLHDLLANRQALITDLMGNNSEADQL